MTSTAIVRQAQGAAVARVPETNFHELMALGESLVTTGFLPRAIRTPAQAVAIILTGRELGIQPMHALRSVHVIEGKPTLATDLQLGLFRRAGGRYAWRESTDQVATIWLRHPSGDEHTETFTIEEAAKAGLAGKDGWKKYPKAMLRARAGSAGLRAIAPDIVGGMYDPEELGADYDASGEIVMPSTPALSVSRSSAPAAAEASAPDRSGEVGTIAASEMTLEEALAYPLPFPQSGAHGTPLGEISIDGLESMMGWIRAKQAERGASFHAETYRAMQLVREHHERAQTTLELDGTAAPGEPASPAEPSLSAEEVAILTADDDTAEYPAATLPAAGSGTTAAQADTALDSVFALTKQLNALLQQLPDGDEMRVQYRQLLVNQKLNDPFKLEMAISAAEGRLAQKAKAGAAPAAPATRRTAGARR